MRVKGKGDYSTQLLGDPSSTVGKIAKDVGNKIGERIGRIFGEKAGRVGRDFGGGALQTVAKLFGHGDYSAAPTSNSVLAGQANATFKNEGRGLRVCHREFITDVVSSTAFVNRSLPINPALPSTFPFLSQIARLFENYKMDGLVFEYVSSSGMVTNTSSALGTVIMATDFNSYGSPFANKQAMESYEWAISAVPYQSFAHCVECAPGERHTNTLFTREGAYEGSLLDYDLGKFQYATVGQPTDGGVLGELWVTYDVVLYKPRILKSLSTPWLRTTAQTMASRSDGVLYMVNNLTYGAGGFFENTYPTNPFFNYSSGPSGYQGQPFGQDTTNRKLAFYRKGRYRVTVSWICTASYNISPCPTAAAITSGVKNYTPGNPVATIGAELTYSNVDLTMGGVNVSAQAGVAVNTVVPGAERPSWSYAINVARSWTPEDPVGGWEIFWNDGPLYAYVISTGLRAATSVSVTHQLEIIQID